MYMDSSLKPAGVPTCDPSRKRALGMFPQQPGHTRHRGAKRLMNRTHKRLSQTEGCSNISAVPKTARLHVSLDIFKCSKDMLRSHHNHPLKTHWPSPQLSASKSISKSNSEIFLLRRAIRTLIPMILPPQLNNLHCRIGKTLQKMICVASSGMHTPKGQEKPKSSMNQRRNSHGS